MLDSEALSRLQAIVLIAIIIVAGVIGGITFVYWNQDQQVSSTIKIGVCVDLGMTWGEGAWQGAVLAAEQLNTEGGILGKQVEVISEDNDASSSPDISVLSNAMDRLITFHKVDFIVGSGGGEKDLVMQDISADHKIIYMQTDRAKDALGERVIEDYERYKYWFTDHPNDTAIIGEFIDSIAGMRELTGFNNVGYLVDDLDWTLPYREAMDYFLPEVHGFNLVYKGTASYEEVDFTSYFAGIEGAGVEALITCFGVQHSIPFIKEWHDLRLSFVVWGINALGMDSQYWEWTEGKCVGESLIVSSFVAGYPINEKTLPAREAFIERWGHVPTTAASATYDAVRFILPDAIERAGTTETEAVIAALEETDLYKTDGRVVFTSSHDLMMGPGYGESIMFQWQKDGARVPVYPKYIMEEAGATFQFPPWPGPWD